jgi:hypothetical protein
MCVYVCLYEISIVFIIYIVSAVLLACQASIEGCFRESTAWKLGKEAD